MADTKLSALTELAATPAVGDELYIRDISEAASAESKRITVANLMAAASAGATLTVAETEVFNGTSPTTWTDLDLSGTIGANAALVLLKVCLSADTPVAFRKDDDADEFYKVSTTLLSGVARAYAAADIHEVFVVAADAGGVIEWKCSNARASTTIDIIAYIK